MAAMPHRIADDNRVHQLRLLGLTEDGFLSGSSHGDFDTLAELAGLATGAPMAGISLVDADDVWVIGRSGITHTSLPRAATFCNELIARDGEYEVVDALASKAFADLDMVQTLGVRSYAGVPLRLATGTTVGALFVHDTRSRQLSDDHLAALRLLAGQAVALLERRRKDVLWLRVQDVLAPHDGHHTDTLEGTAIESALEIASELLGASLAVWTDNVSGINLAVGDRSLLARHQAFDHRLATAPAIGGLDEHILAGADPSTAALRYSGAKIHTRRKIRGTLSFSREPLQAHDPGIDRPWVDLLARYLGELFESQELAESRDGLVRQNDDAAWLNERLLRANDDLRRFARFVVEELGLPLRAVEEQLNALSGHVDTLGPEVSKRIDNLDRGIGRMTSVLNELIAFARYELDLTDTDTIDLNHALERAVNAEAAAIADSGLRISPAPLPQVQADPGQIEQAFRILVRNTIRFGSSEGPELVVSSTTADNRWLISFLDNGTPFPPELVDSAFAIHASEGSELGVPSLALVRKIIERNGGSIEIDATYQRGAHIVLSFPMVDNSRSG